ncbi:SH3 domain-containing protein [Enterobacteriaceae bacterium RIT814]|nr:SH3 domain-containing protein [Enterobacteriaceae bacterium RIT 814]
MKNTTLPNQNYALKLASTLKGFENIYPKFLNSKSQKSFNPIGTVTYEQLEQLRVIALKNKVFTYESLVNKVVNYSKEKFNFSEFEARIAEKTLMKKFLFTKIEFLAGIKHSKDQTSLESKIHYIDSLSSQVKGSVISRKWISDMIGGNNLSDLNFFSERYETIKPLPEIDHHYDWLNNRFAQAIEEAFRIASPESVDTLFEDVLKLSFESSGQRPEVYRKKKAATGDTLVFTTYPTAEERATELKTQIVQKYNSLPISIRWLINIIFVTIIWGALQDEAKEMLRHWVNGTEAYSESLTCKQAVRKSAVIRENDNICWEALNDFRTITGENVRLRMKPSMNADVIEMMAKNTLVAVVGKSGRQWLLVRVESGGETIEGWVTRSYTRPLRR